MWSVRSRPGSVFGRRARVPGPEALPAPGSPSDPERFIRLTDDRLDSLPLPVAPAGPDTSAFLATLDAALEAWWRTATTGPDSAACRWTAHACRSGRPHTPGPGRFVHPDGRLGLRHA